MKIKEGMEADYKKYVENNQDPYGKACVEAGEAVGDALDAGATAEEALDKLYGHDLTGYMAGAAVMGVVHCHPRGEEVKKAWNKSYGVEDAKGVVNPAIIHIKE